MEIEWSARARTDLRELHAYISKDSPYYARRFIDRLLAAVEGLADLPHMGRRVPETDRDDIRELIYRNYRVIYRYGGNRIQIVTLLHGRREILQMPPMPWDVE